MSGRARRSPTPAGGLSGTSSNMTYITVARSPTLSACTALPPQIFSGCTDQIWETSYWWEEERKRYFPHFQERGRKIEAGTNAWSCSDQHSVHVSHQLLNLAQSPLRQLDVFEGLGQNAFLNRVSIFLLTLAQYLSAQPPGGGKEQRFPPPLSFLGEAPRTESVASPWTLVGA